MFQVLWYSYQDVTWAVSLKWWNYFGYPGEREPVGQGLNQPTSGMTGSTSSLSRWTLRLQLWVCWVRQGKCHHCCTDQRWGPQGDHWWSNGNQAVHLCCMVRVERCLWPGMWYPQKVMLVVWCWLLVVVVVVSGFVVPLKGTFQIIEPRLAWLHAPVLKLGNGPCTCLKENRGEAGLRQLKGCWQSTNKAPQNILLGQDSQVRQ